MSVGDSFDEAVRAGADALSFHVAGIREDGDEVPPPRTLEAIRKSGEDWIDWTNALVALRHRRGYEENPVGNDAAIKSLRRNFPWL